MCANVLLYERTWGRGGNSQRYKPRDTNVMQAICKQPIDARNWGCLLYMYIEGKVRSTRKISDRVDYPNAIQIYTGNEEKMVSRIDSLVSPKKNL